MMRKSTATHLLCIIASFTLTAFRVEAADVPISIANLANDYWAGVLPTLPSGTVVFGGFTFDLPSTCPVWRSNGYFSLPPDLTVTQNINVAGVQAVHLLLNTMNTYTSQMSVGQQIGNVSLKFSDGSASTTPLLVGVNIREWAIGTTFQSVINTFTDPHLQEVWREVNNGGVLSVIDMLTIPVSNSSTLTQIIFQDTSIASIGQTNPALFLRGVTLTAVPEPAAWAMVALGVLVLLGNRRLRRRPS